MSQSKRPYIIIPKFIEQPTWGGTYILEMKNWANHGFLKDKKIGQSYELFGNSKLLTSITDTRDSKFVPELGFADKPDIVMEYFPYKKEVDYFILSELVGDEQEAFVGKKIIDTFHKMPLLNKMNQAFGNSFQLHLKQNQTHPRWQPKAESWYYFENGLVSLGLKKGTNIEAYRECCHTINNMMKDLSAKVMSKTLSIEEAKKKSKAEIARLNPWQYVNVYEIEKDSLIDLSGGGIHHSWEEDKSRFPKGNVVYEVQQDVMDPTCTIRSFDQGKFKEDGSIREIHIDDYFQFLDQDESRNAYENLKAKRNGNHLMSTKNYSLDIIEVTNSYNESTYGSFCHLFVREGDIEVQAAEGSIYLGQGHSAFIPATTGEYIMKKAGDKKAIVLKTFIEV